MSFKSNIINCDTLFLTHSYNNFFIDINKSYIDEYYHHVTDKDNYKIINLIITTGFTDNTETIVAKATHCEKHEFYDSIAVTFTAKSVLDRLKCLNFNFNNVKRVGTEGAMNNVQKEAAFWNVLRKHGSWCKKNPSIVIDVTILLLLSLAIYIKHNLNVQKFSRLNSESYNHLNSYVILSKLSKLSSAKIEITEQTSKIGLKSSTQIKRKVRCGSKNGGDGSPKSTRTQLSGCITEYKSNSNNFKNVNFSFLNFHALLAREGGQMRPQDRLDVGVEGRREVTSLDAVEKRSQILDDGSTWSFTTSIAVVKNDLYTAVAVVAYSAVIVAIADVTVMHAAVSVRHNWRGVVTAPAAVVIMADSNEMSLIAMTGEQRYICHHSVVTKHQLTRTTACKEEIKQFNKINYFMKLQIHNYQINYFCIVAIYHIQRWYLNKILNLNVVNGLKSYNAKILNVVNESKVV